MTILAVQRAWLDRQVHPRRRVLARAVAAVPNLVGLGLVVAMWQATDVDRLALGSALGYQQMPSVPGDLAMALTAGLVLLGLLVTDRHLARVRGGELVDDRVVAVVQFLPLVALWAVLDLAASAGLVGLLEGDWWIALWTIPVMALGQVCVDTATWLLPASEQPVEHSVELADGEVATFRHERPRPPRGALVISAAVMVAGFALLGPLGFVVGVAMPWLLGWERPTVVVNRHGLLVELRHAKHRLPWSQVLDVRALDRSDSWWRPRRWWGRPVSGWRRTEVLEVTLTDGQRRYAVCRDAATAAALGRAMLARTRHEDAEVESHLLPILPAPSLGQRLRGEQPAAFPDGPLARIPVVPGS